jgi:hypothetical protein
MLGSNGAASPQGRVKRGIFAQQNQNCRSALLSPGGRYLQRSVVNCDRVKIPHTYQSVIGGFTAPQIWPHLAVLVLSSLLRYAASKIPTIRPGHAEAHFGNGLSPVENEGIRCVKLS